jgi:hypothetical protein
MEFYGKDKKIAIESGVIHYVTKRLIDSVWTATFAVVGEGKIYLISYDRENPVGYKKERELLKCSLKEDDSRNLLEIVIGNDLRSDEQPSDSFDIVNSRHIFSYDGPKEAEIKKFPELKWLLVKTVGQKFGITESKFMNFEEFLNEKAKPKGLWANIRKKRAEGRKPARKGSKAYKKAVAAAKKINESES